MQPYFSTIGSTITVWHLQPESRALQVCNIIILIHKNTETVNMRYATRDKRESIFWTRCFWPGNSQKSAVRARLYLLDLVVGVVVVDEFGAVDA